MSADPSQQPRYFPRGTLELKPDVPGAAFWAVGLDHAMLSYFEVAPGAEFVQHRHESEQITLVLTGSLVFQFADRQVTVAAGKSLRSQGSWHTP